MMDKIDLENSYFHGLAGGIPFWDRDRIIATGLEQLRSIVRCKGIYSRRILKENFGIEYKDKEPEYNGDDYISVCLKNFDDSELYQNGLLLDSSFFRYVRYKIGIALEPDIVNRYQFRKDKYNKLPGERQILNGVKISDFQAIVIGVEQREKIIPKIYKIFENTNVPITDTDGNIICDIEQNIRYTENKEKECLN